MLLSVDISINIRSGLSTFMIFARKPTGYVYRWSHNIAYMYLKNLKNYEENFGLTKQNGLGISVWNLLEPKQKVGAMHGLKHGQSNYTGFAGWHGKKTQCY